MALGKHRDFASSPSEGSFMLLVITRDSSQVRYSELRLDESFSPDHDDRCESVQLL